MTALVSVAHGTLLVRRDAVICQIMCMLPKSAESKLAVRRSENVPGRDNGTSAPFKNGVLDEAALQSLVVGKSQGIDGLVPVNTTGESPTWYAEHPRVVRVMVRQRQARADCCRCGSIQQAGRLPLRNMPRGRG